MALTRCFGQSALRPNDVTYGELNTRGWFMDYLFEALFSHDMFFLKLQHSKNISAES